MQIARRMEPLKGVLVMEMNMRLAKMKQEGRDVINLGIGDPDFNPPVLSSTFYRKPSVILITIIIPAFIRNSR